MSEQMESLRVQTESVTRSLLEKCAKKVEENTKLNALLEETKMGLKRKLDELKTEYDRRLLDETEHLRIQLRATTDSKSGAEIALLKKERDDIRLVYDNLVTKQTDPNPKVSIDAELKACRNKISKLETKLEEVKNKAKIKLENLKLRQEVFNGGRSASPSDVIYRGKKFIRGKLMKKQAEIEQKARDDARDMFRRGIENPVTPGEFSNQRYYSTSPNFRRFMRKIKIETSDEKQAKAVRDEYRKKRRAKRYELTPTLQK